MKKLLLLAMSLAVAASVYAQGTVNFANGAAGVNAPIYYQSVGGAFAAPANGTYLSMLFVGPAGSAASALTTNGVSGSFAPVGTTSPGYVLGGARTITGFASGTQVVLQIRAWNTALGATWEATGAPADGSKPGTGVSNLVPVTLGGGPTPTPNLVGLNSFAISPVPEPSSIALGLLGLGAVALFRRRK